MESKAGFFSWLNFQVRAVKLRGSTVSHKPRFLNIRTLGIPNPKKHERMTQWPPEIEHRMHIKTGSSN